jgi:hypothetical protein
LLMVLMRFDGKQREIKLSTLDPNMEETVL